MKNVVSMLRQSAIKFALLIFVAGCGGALVAPGLAATGGILNLIGIRTTNATTIAESFTSCPAEGGPCQSNTVTLTNDGHCYANWIGNATGGTGAAFPISVDAINGTQVNVAIWNPYNGVSGTVSNSVVLTCEP